MSFLAIFSNYLKCYNTLLLYRKVGEFVSQFFSLRGMNLFDSEDLFYSVTLGDTRLPPPPGGVLRISRGKDDRMGGKIKTQINPWTKTLPPKKSPTKFPSHKNLQKALNDITRKIETLVMECLLIYHTIHLACVHTSPLPQKKLGEETILFSRFFLREGGRLYTGYIHLG